MSTGLFSHGACLGHLTPAGHPERVERLKAVLDTLDDQVFSGLVRREAPRASPDELKRVHNSLLVEAIPFAEIPPGRFAAIDADTAMSSGSAEAALRAAGAVVAAVDAVMAHEMTNAFCAVRPPGHHAERSRAMGFCLFNSIAVGALHARTQHRVGRIAVIDFDVHHGNGTQDIFFDDPSLFYASTHQSPLYPGTGSAAERGVADNIINVPLHPHSGSAEFRAAFETRILPALAAFAPDFVFVSAGFDAHRADPLANLALEASDFGWATERVCELAARQCGSRVVSALEGGYDLEALAASTAAHVQALMRFS